MSNTECDDGVSCNGAEICDPSVINPTDPNDKGCRLSANPPDLEDGFRCTVNERCTAEGIMKDFDHLLCDDNEPCTSDECIAADGVSCRSTADFGGEPCTTRTGRDGICIDGNCIAPCDSDPCMTPGGQQGICIDGNCILPCLVNEPCTALSGQPGVCVEGLCIERCTDVADCDDQIDCTRDVCGGNGLCLNTADDIFCVQENGQFCDGVGEKCIPGHGQADEKGCVPSELITLCDDRRLCTTDRCNPDAENADGSFGVCEFIHIDCAHLNDQCNTGECDDSTGLCVKRADHFNLQCTDGLLCTEGERCAIEDATNMGICVGGTELDCSQLDNSCLQGRCSEERGGVCIAVSTNEGLRCDDHDVCTTDTVCGDGICLGALITCETPANQCKASICDSQSGCREVDARDGTECDDGTACTTEDRCNDGLCLGALIDCPPSNDFCKTAVCDAELGCIFVPANEGVDCNDGIFCTVNDICLAGTCGGIPMTGENLRICEIPDPENPRQCQEVFCNTETDACDVKPANIGQACDVGDICTVDSVCLPDGGCGNGRVVDCSYMDDICGFGGCISAEGGCVKRPYLNENGQPLDTLCDDGFACTTGERCQPYAFCGGGQPLDCSGLDSQCLEGRCNEELEGICIAAATNEGYTCDDNKVCTTNTICANGSCGGGSLRDCSDDDPCTTNERCDTERGCLSDSVTCPDDPANTCRVGLCDPGEGGCTTIPGNFDTACDDGNSCTLETTCQSDGVCGGGTLIDCSNLDAQCLAGRCSEELEGACIAVPADEGVACNDNQLCTTGSVCNGGVCDGGTPLDCTDTNPCTTNERCDTEQGCLSDPVACPDDPANTCRVGLCDPAEGGCTTVPGNFDTACDDGNSCTLETTCQSDGACGGGELFTACNNNNACVDLCDPAANNGLGACVFDPPASRNPEQCDDIDNDCDTSTDEGGICDVPVRFTCMDSQASIAVIDAEDVVLRLVGSCDGQGTNSFDFSVNSRTERGLAVVRKTETLPLGRATVINVGGVEYRIEVKHDMTNPGGVQVDGDLTEAFGTSLGRENHTLSAGGTSFYNISIPNDSRRGAILVDPQ